MASSVYSIPYVYSVQNAQTQRTQFAWAGIMAESAISQYIIEAGQSRELSEIFNGIAEQELAGARRFRDQDWRTLKKVIACRIYAKPILELCHMIDMARNMDQRGRFELLFWGVSPATPINFRDYLVAALDDSTGNAVAEADGISIKYSDGDYKIRYGRMPFLAALMDFVVNAIGYDSFLTAMNKDADSSVESLSSQASALSKSVYRFLEAHLPTVQSQKKFRMITAYLDDKYGETFSDSDIDDDDLLGFWKMISSSAEGEGSNFISYASVFNSFVRFAQSLEYGQTLKSFSYMSSIGGDPEHEEDPDGLMGVLDVIEDGCAPLDRLSEYPMSDVKFLNKREHDAISYMLPRATQIERWPLSYLRSQVFGQGQNRITQALRNKTSIQDLEHLISDSALDNYDECVRGFEKMDGYLQRLLLACFYVVSRVADLEADEISKIDFATLNKARKAFHSISRKGFEEDGVTNDTRIEAFEGAADSIVQIKHTLDQVIKNLSNHGDWERAFVEDSLTFSKQFSYIYGEMK